MIKIETVGKPFARYCAKVIPLAFDESMSYYEMLCNLYNYLKTNVVEVINNNAEATEELQKELLKLKEYVDNYFSNLDIQEEINNKLDEMAESGELTDIIAQYLELAGVLAYDTISDMSEAENITEGSICYCLGYQSYNDGQGGYYKIRTVTVSDTIDGFNIVALSTSNTLIAERMPEYKYLSRFKDTTTNLINDITIKAGYIIETYGYEEVGDGGATKILIVDEAPNDKFYFTLENNLYGIPLTNKNNVLIYGIKGDNTTDNTSLLESAIPYINQLYFPEGTYLFNKIQVQNKNFKIYGDGLGSILKSNNPDALNTFNFIDFNTGEFIIKNLKIDSNYIGTNTTISLVNVNNSIIENCDVSGATNQRTINLQTFDSDYGLNNTIINNIVHKDCESSNSGALIECTGEADNLSQLQYLINTRIENNKCICTSTVYTGDSDLFDCIETDNCKNTVISKNYCETSLHHGISLDTRNINTICDSNTCISTSVLTEVTKNGIEITGTHGADLQNGIISNNIVKDFSSNGISVNAKNYTVVNNRIDNSNRGIIMLSLCTDGNVISNNICSNITDYGIYLDGAVAQARITNNFASLYIGSGTGNILFIQTNMPGSGLNIKDGLSRIHYLNGIYKTDNYSGLNNAGYVMDFLSDGRLLIHNTSSNTWQSITKSNI